MRNMFGNNPLGYDCTDDGKYAFSWTDRLWIPREEVWETANKQNITPTLPYDIDIRLVTEEVSYRSGRWFYIHSEKTLDAAKQFVQNRWIDIATMIKEDQNLDFVVRSMEARIVLASNGAVQHYEPERPISRQPDRYYQPYRNDSNRNYEPDRRFQTNRQY